ncbi:MAG: sialate O-acetylesterase, partial [Bacteroidota bacterium]|nr:sialate O-acetylesterase [Bacteroidota bacterium]
IPLYENRLTQLFTIFRNITQNATLPIVVGELGAYSDNKNDWSAINSAIHHYALTDPYVKVVLSQDLQNKGDRIHFNSEGQRMLGVRYAQAYLSMTKR